MREARSTDEGTTRRILGGMKGAERGKKQEVMLTRLRENKPQPQGQRIEGGGGRGGEGKGQLLRPAQRDCNDPGRRPRR